jgi:hypothetical protein
MTAPTWRLDGAEPKWKLGNTTPHRDVGFDDETWEAITRTLEQIDPQGDGGWEVRSRDESVGTVRYLERSVPGSDPAIGHVERRYLERPDEFRIAGTLELVYQ